MTVAAPDLGLPDSDQQTLSLSPSWPIKLFRRSPLKQEKLRQIERLLPDLNPSGKELVCLDIGSDNGVISYLLRKRGGHWFSCDLEGDNVNSIRSLVGERVEQIDGLSTCYATAQFDLVVIVDFLEHIETDREFACELYRILKPGGTLIVNVPNPRDGVIRRFRNLIGQGDDVHGHVRPGYSEVDLKRVFQDGFTLRQSYSYSRIFSLLIDTAITLGIDLLKGGKRNKKGRVITGDDTETFRKSLHLYTLLYPLFKAVAILDRCFPFLRGNMLIASFQRAETQPRTPVLRMRWPVVDEVLE